MIKPLYITMMAIFISSCAHAPKHKSVRIHSTYSYEDTTKIIMQMVETCWVRSSQPLGGDATSLGSDAIYGIPKVAPNVFIMTIGLDNKDILFSPFARIMVDKRNNRNVVVLVQEKELFFKSKWGVDISVKSWLSGNRKCTNNNENVKHNKQVKTVR